jgi:type IV pilus assembly protein PilV
MRKHHPDQAGFTLIELVVALVVLAVGLLAIAGMQITAIRGNASANVISTKTAVAEGVLEEILSWSILDPRLAHDDRTTAWDFDPDTLGDQDLPLTGAGTFSATYRVQANYNGVVNLTRVEVLVTSSRTTVPTRLVGFKRTI